jgi:hypothetical protein
VNAKHERERMQEAHEQKMHFLHEMHRQQLHHKDREIERLTEKDKGGKQTEKSTMSAEKIGDARPEGREKIVQRRVVTEEVWKGLDGGEGKGESGVG